jgi:hypothetical protein
VAAALPVALGYGAVLVATLYSAASLLLAAAVAVAVTIPFKESAVLAVLAVVVR